MKLVVADAAWEDYFHWQANAANVLQLVEDLIKDCKRTVHGVRGGDYGGRYARPPGSICCRACRPGSRSTQVGDDYFKPPLIGGF